MSAKQKRDKVDIPPIYLRSQTQVDYLQRLISNLPLDPDKPVQVLIREEPRQRKKSANDAYWAGPMRDIEEKAWHKGRKYRAEEWHEGFKELFLPDPDSPDFNPRHVTNPDEYRKWDTNPITGKRSCVGSTTQLTDEGMWDFRTQVEALMSQEYGVQFTERIEPQGRLIA